MGSSDFFRVKDREPKLIKLTMRLECACGEVRRIDCPELVIDARQQEIADEPCGTCGLRKYNSLVLEPEYE